VLVDLLETSVAEADCLLKQGAVYSRCIWVLDELNIHLTVLSILQQKISLENFKYFMTIHEYFIM